MSNTTSKPVFVNTEMSKAVVDALKTGDRADRAMAKLADIATGQWGADAVFHFISPKSKDSLASEEEWTGLRDVVVSTFTEARQNLLSRPIDSLSDAEKKQRKTAQQQIGSKIKDIKNGIKRRLQADQPKEAKAPRAPDVRIRDAAQDIIKVCENVETSTFRPAEIKALAEQIIRSI